MKKLLIPIILLLLIASCKTKEQRANRLIERANKLYPIKDMVSTVIKIDTLIKIDTFIIIKKDTVQVTIPVVDKDGKAVIYKNKLLKETSKYKIIGNTLSSGDLDLTVYIKEQKVNIELWTRFKKEIIVNKEVITKAPIYKKGFFYWFGILAVIGIVLILIKIIISSIRRKLE